MSLFARLCALSLALLVAVPMLVPPAAAQWNPGGAPVAVGPAISRTSPAQIPDGSGGAFMVWSEDRANGNSLDTYVQRIDMSGYPLWAVNGISVQPTAADQYLPALTDDGAGGIIVAWSDTRNGAEDIYAQRYNSAGTPLWTAGGVLVCDAADIQQWPTLVGDDLGGAFIVWEDWRFSAADIDVYANRVNAVGTPLFGTGGFAVSGPVTNQTRPKIISDGAGGAIFAWYDARSSNLDVYAQRIDNLNNLLWTANGNAVSTAALDQVLLDMVADGSGGAIMAWHDYRSGAGSDIYVQRVDGTGGNLWTPNGVAVCVATGNQNGPSLAADGAGGAVIAWDDQRVAGVSVYAEHVDNLGVTRWQVDGQPVAALGGVNVSLGAKIVRVGDTFIVVWQDDRAGPFQVYGQRLLLDGTEMWTPSGLEITSSGSVAVPAVMADDFGGAIVAWIDYRSNRPDLFAQRLEPSHGEWGRPEPTIASSADNPGDQGGYIELEWYASDRDKQPFTLIPYYSAWRSTEPPAFNVALAADKAGPGSSAVAAARAQWPDANIVTDPTTLAADFVGMAIWVEERAGAATAFWEWMVNQTAAYQPGYSYLMPTRSDSSSAGPAPHYFKVIAHTWDQFIFWESQPSAGYSVDNLAPGAPLLLVAVRVGNHVRLDWDPSGLNEPDFSQYVVYRATSSGVTPVPLYLLDNTTEETLWDQNAPAGMPYYYIVTARDVHGNQSLPSNEANVDGTATGIGDDVPALTSLQVMPNVPNPFGDATTLRVGLPNDGDIALEVYDVAGRRVFARTYPSAARGWRDITFDGRDAAGRVLPGGVYFYRVRAAGTTVTRKMVLMR